MAVLLSARRRVVGRDRIIESVWGDHLPNDPRNTLQHYISRLRRVLGPGPGGAEVIRRVGEGYVLSPGHEEVDADRFNSGVTAAREARRTGRPEEAERLLTRAIGEWRGRPYENLHIDALSVDIRELEEAWLDASEDLADVRLALGRHRECVPELERLVAEHPIRERFWGQLMTALYRSGRQAEALRAYQRCRRHLVESLGIFPGEDLRILEERMLTGEPLPDPMGDSTPLVHVNPVGELPTPPNRFIGRADVLDALRSTISGSEVTTVLGASGAGKTRLAIEVGSRAERDFADGVIFVSLDGLTSARRVAQVVAATVGLREDPRRLLPEALADHLAPLDALVILDGCDRVTDGCVDLLTRFRGRRSRVVFLATSSVVLGLAGETRFDVGPLGNNSTQYPGSDGIDLFVERARLVMPGWVPRRPEIDTVGEIVGALDGSPLAIELAAARLDVRSLDDIATDLGAGSSGKGHLLSTTELSAPSEVAEWSIGRMSGQEIRIYESLAVFAQGFDLEAATRVTQVHPGGMDLAGCLARLARRSLIRVDRSADGVRYVMPAALRGIVWDRFLDRDDSSRLRRSHADWFAQLAGRAEVELRGPDLSRWVHVLTNERSNLHAALDWCQQSGETETLRRLTAGLCRFWDWAGRLSDATYWVSRALEGRSGPDSEATTWILVWSSYFLIEAGDLEAALARTAEAIASAEISGDPDQLTAAWGNRGIVLRRRGELAHAVEAGRNALHAGGSEAGAWFQAWAVSALGATQHQAGLNGEARANAERSLRGFRLLGDHASEAWSLDLLARTALTEGDLRRAEEHARHALLKAHLLGARRTLAATLRTLALIGQQRGDLRWAVSLTSAAHAMVDQGAVSHLGAGSGIASVAARQLTPGEYTTAWERGRTLDLDAILTP